MIRFLRGQPLSIGDHFSVVVHDVGYDVKVGAATLAKISHLNPVELFIFTYVKEDRLELYGFLTPTQLNLFEIFLSVSGVGPRTALVLTDTDPSAVISAIQEAKVAFFTATPRVGKKLAQKIIIELKSKLGSLKELNLSPLSGKQQDLADALQALGYDDRQIESAMGQIEVDQLTIQAAIKQAVKILSTKNLI